MQYCASVTQTVLPIIMGQSVYCQSSSLRVTLPLRIVFAYRACGIFEDHPVFVFGRCWYRIQVALQEVSVSMDGICAKIRRFLCPRVGVFPRVAVRLYQDGCV